MSDPSSSLASVERVIRPRHGLAAINLREFWLFRELFWFLAWRDILIRYKQTYIGVAWALLQPLLMTVVSTLVFYKLGRFPSGSAPYPVMSFVALMPWLFFANAMATSSHSLVQSSNMVSKIYFPRLIIPASAVLSGVVDFLISLGILVVMMMVFKVDFTARLLLLPVFFLAAFLTAFAVGIWLSALNVRYRDVKYVVPFMVQMGLYASPVFYMSSMVPWQWQFLYNLNPMSGVIDGFRWCVLGGAFEPFWPGFIVSLEFVFLLLVTGAFYFRTAEKTFADVI